MIDGLPRKNPDPPVALSERPDYVAAQETGRARNCDQPAHDECSVRGSAPESDPIAKESACCWGSPSKKARYISRARIRLILPEDVRGRALCETSTTEHLRPAVASATELTALRNASRNAGSDVRHCTRITTPSASCSSTEKATTSPRRIPSIWCSTANSRSSGHTLRPLTRMRSLLRPATTIDPPTR